MLDKEYAYAYSGAAWMFVDDKVPWKSMPNNVLEDRLLTAKEAALYLNLAEGTVRNKANRGEIPFVRLGSNKDAPLRFRKSELDQWMAESTQAETAKLSDSVSA